MCANRRPGPLGQVAQRLGKALAREMDDEMIHAAAVVRRRCVDEAQATAGGERAQRKSVNREMVRFVVTMPRHEAALSGVHQHNRAKQWCALPETIARVISETTTKRSNVELNREPRY